MELFKNKYIVEDHKHSLGFKLKFNSNKFNGGNLLSLFICFFICTILIHFVIFLFNHFFYNTPEANFTQSNFLRFIFEIFLGFWIGVSFFSTSSYKNIIDLHQNLLTFKNNFKETTLKITAIDKIETNFPLSSNYFNYNQYYVYANIKGKRYKLHRGFITRQQASDIIKKINL